MHTKRFHYAPIDDLIIFVEPNLIEVHFGPSTMTLEENTAETHWVKGCYDEIKATHPTARFHVLIDLTRVSSGEYNSEETNKMYRAMLKESAIEKVAVYGLSNGWSMFIDFLTFFTKHKLKTFVTEEQARTWLNKCHAQSH